MRKVREQKECLQALKEACYITITTGQHENPDEQWKSVAVTAIKLLSQQRHCSHSNVCRSYRRNVMGDF